MNKTNLDKITIGESKWLEKAKDRTQGNNYFVVFKIDFTTKAGQELANRMDTDDTREFIRGFFTKSGMKSFVSDNTDAFKHIMMLKPVS
jgi:hypothetical protein